MSVSEKDTLRNILKENICWTCTKEDIINKQIPDLVTIWLRSKLKECETFGHWYNNYSLTVEELIGDLANECS